MNTLKRYLGIVSIITILALLIGTASAADTTSTSVRGNGAFTMGTGHQGHAGNTTQEHQMLQSFITKLGQQGVSVIEIQADIASGNIPAAIQWLKSYYLAHPELMTKGPRQQTTGNITHQQRNAGYTSHNQTLQVRGPAGHSWAQNRTQNTGSSQ
ncbi:MAG: hypothetical protein WC620_03605 [Methanoregula sp.]|jgi:hypothetical protein